MYGNMSAGSQFGDWMRYICTAVDSSVMSLRIEIAGGAETTVLDGKWLTQLRHLARRRWWCVVRRVERRGPGLTAAERFCAWVGPAAQGVYIGYLYTTCIYRRAAWDGWQRRWGTSVQRTRMDGRHWRQKRECNDVRVQSIFRRHGRVRCMGQNRFGGTGKPV